MGPNPKYIFQGLFLLTGILVFVAVVMFLKVRSGRSFKEILADCNRISAFSLGAAAILLVVGLVIFVVLKNWG
ncbi:MAG: hypothetical protein A3F90_12210 [Deltaproteobacteria bacterium RIFCSPLOWO2_12_FULL_60_19]|nr:MAG: hypothetical protein A3F90_12210 [Deltaproteobacteria bacterium RIFCSPLOWO2_12_FULL_60_19]